MCFSITIHKASVLSLIILSKKKTTINPLLIKQLAKRIKMNYTRIATTYHEEIDLKGCFNQGMGAAARAICHHRREFNDKYITNQASQWLD